MGKIIQVNCHGIDFGDAVLPPFVLYEGEVIAVVEIREYGRWRERIMKILGGRSGCEHIEIAQPGTVVSPILSDYDPDQITIEYLMGRGINYHIADRVLASVGIDPNYPLGVLAGNEQLLMAILIEWANATPFIVISTAALDATGIRRIINGLNERRESCTAIDVFQSRHLDFYREAGVLDKFDKIIHVRRKEPLAGAECC